jgi:hypothetical protein
MTTKQGLSEEDREVILRVVGGMCFLSADRFITEQERCSERGALGDELCAVVDAIAEARAAVARGLLAELHREYRGQVGWEPGDLDDKIAAELARLKT